MAAFEVIALDTATPQLRAPGAADTYTFPRAVELPLGTANGVLYLNGSKVVTSGSGLTFDGTNLGVGAAPTGFGKLDVRNGTNFRVLINGIAGYGSNAIAGINDVGSETHLGLAGTPIAFYVQAAEQMRLTSTGLGIGTSSPAGGSQLTAYGASNGQIAVQNSTNWSRLLQNSNDLYIDNGVGGSAGNIVFRNSSSTIERMRLDSSGNLGLGVTPSAWSGVSNVFQIAGNAYIASTTHVLNHTANGYYNGSNWIYTSTNFASQTEQVSGQHRWYTAPSGTAGNAISFTQALTLDANRNLLLNGTAAPASGVGTLAIFNGTAPTGSVTNGIVLYAEDVSSSSELKVRDEAGNVTTLSPHNFELIPEGPSEDMAWSYYSERDGKRINVDMLKAIRLLEKLSGEQLVYEA
jgi:hypothetical protein